MSLDECATNAFKELSTPVLATISVLCDNAIAALQTIKLQKQSLSISMDISLFPLKLKKTVLNTLVDTARQQAHVIPSEIVALCPDIGALNTQLEAALVGAIEGQANAAFDADIMLCQQAEINANIDSIDTAIKYFQDIKMAISNAQSN